MLCPALGHQVVLKACLMLLSDFSQWCHCPKNLGFGDKGLVASGRSTPAGFVGVEINAGSLLSNSQVEEIFIPGHSHRVTLPRGVIVYVGVFMAAVNHFQSLWKESFWDASS